MVKYCQDNLEQIKCLTDTICSKHYHKPVLCLFNSTVGQHVRHVLEFYLCLLDGVENRLINYDKRKREIEIELNPETASKIITQIIDQLGSIQKNIPIEIEANYHVEGEDVLRVESSLYRELGYCLEHCIHHQALIKTGLSELDNLDLICRDFGIAPSTLRNLKKCVQ